MSKCDQSVDVVVVGSGGSGLCAGILLADAGKNTLIVEKTDKVGGSTAMSGGAIWIPNHPLQAENNVEDSYEMAQAYFDAMAADADGGKGATPERVNMYLREGPKMVRYLIDRGMKFLRCEGWSDYHCELPGGHVRSRTIAADIFDARRLGFWNDKLRRGTRQMPICGTEGRDLMLYRHSLTGLRAAVLYSLRRAYMKISGAELVGLGTALAGRLLEIALKVGVRIQTETPVTQIVTLDGRVTGVVVTQNGETRRIQARDGIIVAAGGFSHDLKRRQKYNPGLPDASFTHASPGDTGEVLDMMVALGAITDNMDQAIWVSTSHPPGRGIAMEGNAITGKPHAVVVGPDGKRFGNESGSYMQFGQAQLAAKAIPAWAIFESRHRNRYFMGGATPGSTPAAWFESGYMKKADTIEDLAELMGLDRVALRETIDRFNGFARAGVDEDFDRGANAYNHWYGDPRHKPNPCLGPIEKPPFYAIKLYPGDVGTFGGVVTDQFARVIDSGGAPIEGLYAAGNCTAGVTGKHYPGGGGSIGPALTFGYVAARHLLGADDLGSPTASAGSSARASASPAR